MYQQKFDFQKFARKS